MGILKMREIKMSARIVACRRLISTFGNHLEDFFSTWILREAIYLLKGKCFLVVVRLGLHRAH